MAKKLMLGYGEYRANREYHGETLSGSPSLQHDRDPEGELEDAPDVWTQTGDGVSHFSRHSVTFDQLWGTLRSNPEVVLLDVSINQWWAEEASFAATYGVVGVGVGVPDDCSSPRSSFRLAG
jgi:hypothetical protein